MTADVLEFAMVSFWMGYAAGFLTPLPLIFILHMKIKSRPLQRK